MIEKTDNQNTDRRIPAGTRMACTVPVIVFCFLYVMVSVILDDFYKMPIAVASSSLQCGSAIYRGHPLMNAIETFSRAGRTFQHSVYDMGVRSRRALQRLQKKSSD
ncbi:hypothetical protein [Duncaniella dubosii]|uniref:hypothetical protein n=1 Tax=Duncaniella dubosii TaxID=2518971 RepID=UPI003F666CF8